MNTSISDVVQAQPELPSANELFHDEVFEAGTEMKQDQVKNIVKESDELEKYLGKKSTGISSYTRKNSVNENEDRPVKNEKLSPMWKLTLCVKKAQKTNYSEIAAKIRKDKIIYTEIGNSIKNPDVPLSDPRKKDIMEISSKNNQKISEKFENFKNETISHITEEQDMDLHLYLSDDDDEIFSVDESEENLNDEQRIKSVC